MKKREIKPVLYFFGFAIFLHAGILAHEGSHEFSIPLEKIKSSETLDAIRIYGRLSAYHPDAEEHFSEALLSRNDVESFVKNRLQEIPQTAFNGDQRNFYFKLLASLRTPWAVRICGQYLTSDVEVELPEFQTEEESVRFFFENGGSTTTNSDYAMLALEKMDIRTAPFNLKTQIYPGKINRKAVWREWWLRNQAYIEKLLELEEITKISPNNNTADIVENMITFDNQLDHFMEPDTKDREEKKSTRWQYIVWVLVGLSTLGILLIGLFRISQRN